MTFERAVPADAAETLALRRSAYQSEAALYPGVAIPPLTQTQEEIVAEFAHATFMKAVVDGQIVGSVRARQDGDTAHIGRLIVRPDRQGQGTGTRLMREIEGASPQARRFALLTGHRSVGNLRLYDRLGYAEVSREAAAPSLTLSFVEKHSGPRARHPEP